MSDIICSQVYTQYTALGEKTKAAANSLKGPLGIIKTELGALTAASQTEIDTLKNAVGGVAPALPAVPSGGSDVDIMKCIFPESAQKIQDAIDAGKSLMELPAEMAGAFVDAAIKDAKKLLNTLLTGSGLPMGHVLDQINKFVKLLKGLGLPESLALLDRMWQCINVNCPGQFPSMPTYSLDIRTDLGLDEAGTFDYKSSDLGLSLPTEVTTQMDELKTSTDSLEESIKVLEQSRPKAPTMPDSPSFPSVSKVPDIKSVVKNPFGA
jgi:hypothetical protein